MPLDQVGRKIAKHFDGHGVFTGTIVSYLPKPKAAQPSELAPSEPSEAAAATTAVGATELDWFRVVYTDGDSEDLSWPQLKDALLLKTRSCSTDVGSGSCPDSRKHPQPTQQSSARNSTGLQGFKIPKKKSILMLTM